MSSPMRRTFSSRSISCSMASLRASRYVFSGTRLLLPHVLVIAGVDVGVELLHLGLFALVGEAGDLANGLLHLVLYLLQPVLVELASLQEFVLQEPQGISLAPLLDLVFRPVLLEEVRRSMRRGPVRQRLYGVGL